MCIGRNYAQNVLLALTVQSHGIGKQGLVVVDPGSSFGSA